jgi:alpha-1,6-mannosyltransferase
VQRLQLNPYTVSPALAALQDPAHPLAAGTTVSTLYPPLSEVTFRLVQTVPGYKRLFTALDLAAVALLLLLLAAQKRPLDHVLTYAWNPTVVVSFAMCGHPDSLAIATLLAANLCIIGSKRTLSHIFLALSFLSKFFAVVLLPVFFREVKRRWYAYASLFGRLVILGYLPYLGAGRRLFKGLSDYAAGWEGNDSLFRLIRLAGNSRAQAEPVAGVLLLALVAYGLRNRMTPLGASLFIVAGLLLLSPNAFPWYFTWIIPFLCFYPRGPLLLVSVTCVLGYTPVVGYAAGQPYRDSPFILALEYAPVFAWLACEAWRGSGFGLGIQR